MQLALYPILSLVIIVHALFLQGVWLFMARRARDIYLGDIMLFRSPTSTLSRYYDWRVTSFYNAIIEGIIFQFILVGSLIGMSLVLANFTAFIDAILYVLFVMVLSFMSSMQTAWRVREINHQERYLVTSIGTSTDKIGVARELIDNLILQGTMGDGRVWFALYRLTQKPNQVGWAIRDVLIEKAQELRKMDQYQPKDPASSDKGPGIS
jgi:hypothetical protein